MTKPAILVGASGAADLMITDATVSWHHAEIRALAGGLCIRDLDSSNGLFVNGDRIREALLAGGSQFRLGRVELEVSSSDESAASETDTDPPGNPAQGQIERLGEAMGVSMLTREIFERMRKVANSTSTVMFVGELGTGRSTLARALHELSPRREGPFVAVDLHRLEPPAAERALFGRGAAGLSRGREAAASSLDDGEGAIERAHNGTVFLEHVEALPPSLWPRLQRFLDQGELRRSGESFHRRVDARVLSSMGPEPPISKSSSPETSLLGRLAAVRIEVPKLRDRVADVASLARQFFGDLGLPQLEPGERTLALLTGHPFGGNVADLRIALEWALYPEARPATVQGSLPPGPLTQRPDFEPLERLRDAIVADTVTSAAGDVRRAAERLSLSTARVFQILDQQGFDLESLI